MQQRHAFTLVELSIVLVIIGLLVGGILAGQSMLRAQAVRNGLQNARAHAVAIQQFSEKYAAFPGDMPNATRLWGRADGGVDTTQNCASPATNASNGTTTCNGDGNGVINTTEGYWAWQQLKAAGLIAGNYTGIAGAGAIGGINVPNGSIDHSAYWLTDWAVQTTGGNYFAGDYQSVMVFGNEVAASWPSKPVITAAEMYAMDKKADDGAPALGDIRSLNNSWGANCATSDVPTTAVYNLAASDRPGCIVLFLRTFAAKPKN